MSMNILSEMVTVIEQMYSRILEKQIKVYKHQLTQITIGFIFLGLLFIRITLEKYFQMDKLLSVLAASFCTGVCTFLFIVQQKEIRTLQLDMQIEERLLDSLMETYGEYKNEIIDEVPEEQKKLLQIRMNRIFIMKR